jgi:hypothetical protein
MACPPIYSIVQYKLPCKHSRAAMRQTHRCHCGWYMTRWPALCVAGAAAFDNHSSQLHVSHSVPTWRKRFGVLHGASMHGAMPLPFLCHIQSLPTYLPTYLFGHGCTHSVLTSAVFGGHTQLWYIPLDWQTNLHVTCMTDALFLAVGLVIGWHCLVRVSTSCICSTAFWLNAVFMFWAVVWWLVITFRVMET